MTIKIYSEKQVELCNRLKATYVYISLLVRSLTILIIHQAFFYLYFR